MEEETRYTKQDLETMRAWTLQRKIQVTQTRLIEWLGRYDWNVYVSFSGGKDSTVLADLAARVYQVFSCPKRQDPLRLVFVNTGLEYPEIQKFVRDFAEWLKAKYKIPVELEILHPSMTFPQVLSKYGYVPHGTLHMGGMTMTERERLLAKIRKVQALANRGADGEKQSAAALLDRLMTQYGIDEAEIAEERLEKCFFRYKTPYERKLLVQVIYTVTGKIPFKCVGSYSGRARKQVGIDCTAAERLEIEFSYEFYKAALEEEMERFYSAFLMKNDIFPPASKKAEEIPAAEISRSEALKLQALMAGMGDHTRRPVLGSGVEP